MAAIGSHLSRGEHDVVLLQEVWVEEDYETIKTLVSDTFPHSHFFDNGIIGSGTCVFSRVGADPTRVRLVMNRDNQIGTLQSTLD